MIASSSSIPSSASPGPSSTIEQLPASIPHLEPDGSNWAVFVIRFRELMQVTRRWGFFDGSNTKPLAKDPLNTTDEEKEAEEKWIYDDLVARYLLSQRLPDSTFVRLGTCPTAHLRWVRVSDEFEAKSIYAQTRAQNDLETAFDEMRCPKGGDIRAFLTSMQLKHEELAATGVTVSHRKYQQMVLKNIPEELARFASLLLSTARLVHPPTIVDTGTLIDLICKEADRLKYRRAESQAAGDEALASESRNRRRKGKCHNCGKPGHWARECRSSKKEKSSNNSRKLETIPIGTESNVVTAHDEDVDGCWVADLAPGAPDS